MARNKQFNPEREPLKHDNTLQPIKSRIEGPFSFLNPTQAHYSHKNASPKPSSSQKESDDDDSDAVAEGEDKKADSDTPQAASNVHFKWTSRNNRKGRHAIVVNPTAIDSPNKRYETPLPSTNISRILRTSLRMFIYCK